MAWGFALLGGVWVEGLGCKVCSTGSAGLSRVLTPKDLVSVRRIVQSFAVEVRGLRRRCTRTRRLAQDLVTGESRMVLVSRVF